MVILEPVTMLTDYTLGALCLWFTATLWRRSKLWVAAFLVTVACLLEQVDSPFRRFTADGGYDTRSVYELLGEVGPADIKA
jgi:hypothetical protein